MTITINSTIMEDQDQNRFVPKSKKKISTYVVNNNILRILRHSCEMDFSAGTYELLTESDSAEKTRI